MKTRRPQLTISALLATTAFVAVMLGLGRAVSPLVSPETWRTLALWAALLAPIVVVAYGLGFLHARRRYRHH